MGTRGRGGCRRGDAADAFHTSLCTTYDCDDKVGYLLLEQDTYIVARDGPHGSWNL